MFMPNQPEPQLRQRLTDVFKDKWGWTEPPLCEVVDLVLSLPGIAIVELPEPDMVGDFGQVWNSGVAERFHGPIGTVQVRPDGRVEIRDDYENDYTPDAVRIDAAVLLAAAVKAEETA